MKYSRAIGGAEGAYDFPPHVVDVATTFEQRHLEDVDGGLCCATALGPDRPLLADLREPGRAQLVTHQPKAWSITNAGPSTPHAFWPHADASAAAGGLASGGGRGRSVLMGATTDRYAVISADCHGGASVLGYRPFLAEPPRRLRPLGRRSSRTCTRDNLGDDADRNWSLERRLAEMEADGVVAEVIYPNTVPPFFLKGSLVRAAARRHVTATSPSAGPASRPTTAGWPTSQPGAGPPCRHRPDHVARRRRSVAGDRVGQGQRPDRRRPPPRRAAGLGRAAALRPRLRADLVGVARTSGLPINHHSGSAVPDMGPYPSAQMMFLLEVVWWAHRSLLAPHLLRRHGAAPGAAVRLHRAGHGVALEELTRLDYYRGRFSGTGGASGSQEAKFGEGAVEELSLSPQRVLATPVPRLGSSFIRRHEVAMRDQVGVDRIMWGSDFPHLEGCWPYSRTHLRLAFAGVPTDEVRRMVGRNAADLYGLDWPLLERLADEHGPDAGRGGRPAAGRGHPRRVAALPGVRGSEVRR